MLFCSESLHYCTFSNACRMRRETCRIAMRSYCPICSSYIGRFQHLYVLLTATICLTFSNYIGYFQQLYGLFPASIYPIFSNYIGCFQHLYIQLAGDISIFFITRTRKLMHFGFGNQKPGYC